jgi:hypothetical protein
VETSTVLSSEFLPAFRSLLKQTPDTKLFPSFLVQTFNRMDILPNLHALFDIRAPTFSNIGTYKNVPMLPALCAALVADDTREMSHRELTGLLYELQLGSNTTCLKNDDNCVLIAEFAAFAAAERNNVSRLRRMDTTLATNILPTLYSGKSIEFQIEYFIDLMMWGGLLDSIRTLMRTSEYLPRHFPREWSAKATSETDRQAITTIASAARVALVPFLSPETDNFLATVHLGGLQYVFLDIVARIAMGTTERKMFAENVKRRRPLAPT